MTYKEIYKIIGAPIENELTINDKITIRKNAMIVYIINHDYFFSELKDYTFAELAHLCAEIIKSER